MRILVCVKRVPAPGARINITADGQAIDTAFLGFTTSPHEECAVEEAVQLVEKPRRRGDRADPRPGRGRRAAALRGQPRRRQGRAAADPTAPRLGSAAHGRGDRRGDRRHRGRRRPVRPDPVRQRVGRLRRLPGRRSASPTRSAGRWSTASRASRSHGRRRSRARRESDAGVEVYELPMPAVLGVKEGINLPRYPTLKGRLASKKVEVAHGRTAAAAGRPADARAAAGRPSRSTATDHPRQRPRRRGRRRRPARRTRGAAMTVLVVVEHDRGTIAPATFEALAAARALGRDRARGLTIGAAADRLVERARRATASRLFIRPTTTCWPTTGPRRGARSSPKRCVADSPTVVLATGTDRGNEVIAHAAARARRCRWSPTARRVTPRRRRLDGRLGCAGAARCSSAARSTRRSSC